MHQEKAQRLLQAGRDRGADFVELFEEETRHASVSFKDKKVESASAGTDYGIGIRLLLELKCFTRIPAKMTKSICCA